MVNDSKGYFTGKSVGLALISYAQIRVQSDSTGFIHC